jgi:hypothetical protein
MANTKKTPRKEGHRCPMCNLRIMNEAEWEKHVVECGRQRRQKKFECIECGYATNKKSDMGRHRRTHHSEIGVALTAADSGTDDWEQLYPGNLSDVVGSTSQNCPTDEVCQRKPTRPVPVSVSVLKSIACQDPLAPRAPSPFQHPMTTPRKRVLVQLDVPSASLSCASREASTQTYSILVDASTQVSTECAEISTKTEGEKRRKLDRVQETYQRDGRTIVEVHDEENWL